MFRRTKLIAYVLFIGFWEIASYAVCNLFINPYYVDYKKSGMLSKPNRYEPYEPKFNHDLFENLNIILIAIILLYFSILFFRKNKSS